MPISFTNTLTRQKEAFTPLIEGQVKIYNCGPTVYAAPHIGNFRAFLFADLLRRSLEFLGLEVTQVMNITDVGHLTSDSDSGEDKLEKGAREEKVGPLEVARKYEKEFLADLKKLNILTPHRLPRASEHIKEQIELIKKLAEKGFTYETSDGIYFDTSKFKNYGKLGGQKQEEKKAGKRVEVKSEKKNPADFALWKFCVGENANHILRWDFETGKDLSGTNDQEPRTANQTGFPGWHIECSAMSLKYLAPELLATGNWELGTAFDIHTGGVDHIPVHHENEIAQSEAATGKKFVNYWLHNEFLAVDGGKMSKSLGNLYTVADIEEKGFDPLAFRYLTLGTHYRTKLNFTWEALKGARQALTNLREIYQALPEAQEPFQSSVAKFSEALADDLNSPQALAVAWEIAKNETIEPGIKKATLDKFDEVLALDLAKSEKPVELSSEQEKLLDERAAARKEKNWERSDEIRDEFAKQGLEIEDAGDQQVVKKKL
ncbi:MAG: cysteine--tRNA ligase [Patescibacteria group bacterium]